MNTQKIKKGSLEPLLQTSVISYYWLGFVMADGYFSKNNRFKIILANKDKDHVIKLADFLKFNGKFIINKKNHATGFAIMDKKIIKKIKNKFSISNQKSYIPCNIQRIKNNKLFLAWLIGFIDGDGCIKKHCQRPVAQISIKLHNSWLQNLIYMCEKFYNIVKTECHCQPKMLNSGYAHWVIVKFELVKKLKKYAIKMNLPILLRKWNNIDLNYKTHYEIGAEHSKKIKYLYNDGYSQTEICKKLKLSPACISMILSGKRVKGRC